MSSQDHQHAAAYTKVLTVLHTSSGSVRLQANFLLSYITTSDLSSQVGSPSVLGRMPTIREPDVSPIPLVAIHMDEEGQMTGITCPLNVGVDPHDIEGCEDLLESYFMQVPTLLLTHAQSWDLWCLSFYLMGRTWPC